MKNIFRKLKSVARAHKKLSAAVLVALVIATPLAAHAGFFPGRPTYDYNNYNGNNKALAAQWLFCVMMCRSACGAAAANCWIARK